MPKPTRSATRNELLIYEREKQHWRQEDVADQIERLLGQGKAERTRTIRKWESGIVKRPEDYYLKELMRIFGRTAEQLGYPDEGKISFWGVPYPRNPFFTGRQAILEETLHALLASRSP